MPGPPVARAFCSPPFFAKSGSGGQSGQYWARRPILSFWQGIGRARQLAARLPLKTLRPTENTDFSFIYSDFSGLQRISGKSLPSHHKSSDFGLNCQHWARRPVNGLARDAPATRASHARPARCRAQPASRRRVAGAPRFSDTRSGFLLGFELFFDFGFDVGVEDGVAFEEFLDGITALGELGAIVGEPRAALLNDLHFQGEV